MSRYLIISLGAIVGANLRYIIQTWFSDRGWTAFPYATLLINVTGAFILALFVTLATERLALDPNYRLLVAVGFCGAFTTFSSLTYETWSVGQASGWWLALVNLGGSAVLGMLATFLGIVAARALGR